MDFLCSVCSKKLRTIPHMKKGVVGLWCDRCGSMLVMNEGDDYYEMKAPLLVERARDYVAELYAGKKTTDQANTTSQYLTAVARLGECVARKS